MSYTIDFEFCGPVSFAPDEHDAACAAAERVLAGRGREARAAFVAMADDGPYDADLAALWDRAASEAIAAGCVGWRGDQDSITMVIA